LPDRAALQAENARLIALLEAHGIEWRPPQPAVFAAREPEPSRLSTAEKVALFRRLFRGRTDVYPVRWEGKTSGKSGYTPACANEWRAGVCEKPRIKCGDCSNRLLTPLSDAVIYDHLAGEHTVGVYPLLEDDSCYLLAVDFDETEWRDDARAFMQSCDALGVPTAQCSYGGWKQCSVVRLSSPPITRVWIVSGSFFLPEIPAPRGVVASGPVGSDRPEGPKPPTCPARAVSFLYLTCVVVEQRALPNYICFHRPFRHPPGMQGRIGRYPRGAEFPRGPSQECALRARYRTPPRRVPSSRSVRLAACRTEVENG